MCDSRRAVELVGGTSQAGGVPHDSNAHTSACARRAPLGLAGLLTTIARVGMMATRSSPFRGQQQAVEPAASSTSIVTVSPMAALGHYWRLEGPVTPPSLCAIRSGEPARA